MLYCKYGWNVKQDLWYYLGFVGYLVVVKAYWRDTLEAYMMLNAVKQQSGPGKWELNVRS